jgi:hypothetical protein
MLKTLVAYLDQYVIGQAVAGKERVKLTHLGAK